MKVTHNYIDIPSDSSIPLVKVKRYHPVCIANYFLQLAKAGRCRLDLLKLVKLVYMAHGWSLYFCHAPLIDESVEAWPIGPMIPSVYYVFKQQGRRIIKKPIKSIEQVGGKVLGLNRAFDEDEETQRLLKKVWKAYHLFSSQQLSDLTYLPDGAWEKTQARTTTPIRNQQIDDALIQQEFKTRFEEYGQEIHRNIQTLQDIRF